MKKILLLGMVLINIILIQSFASAESILISLGETEVKNYTTNGYTLSDNFSTSGECENTKNKYNEEFSSYKRSDCFSYKNNYNYFICGGEDTCSIQNISVSTSSSTGNTESNIKNKDKLDKFIEKLGEIKNTMSSDKYQSTLDNVVSKLNKLEEKYTSNINIKNMIVYLKDGIKGLYEQSDEDDFFCELTDSCTESISTGIVIGGGCGSVHGMTIDIKPTYNLCSSGITASAVTSNEIGTKYVWNCENKLCYVNKGNIITLTTNVITDLKLNKTEAKVGDSVVLAYGVSTDRTCDIYVVKTNEYVKKDIAGGSSGNIDYLIKTADINSTTGYVNFEMKCTNGSTKTRSIKINTTTGNANTCGTGKKQIGVVCVTDTAQVNPNGNYKIGQGACVSHIGDDVGYNGSAYTKSINGQTHGIGSTLNQCIERCDIGNINIGGNGANCFYEGAIIRSGINGSITNVTTGNIITLTTNVITDLKLNKTEAKVGDSVVLAYGISTDRTCDIYVVNTNEYVKKDIAGGSSGNIDYLIKTADINSTTGYVNFEMKCTNGSTKTRSIKINTTTGNANTCGTGKKQIGVVCVTDTAQVNPNGNYKIGQGACVSHIGDDVGYNGSAYTKSIDGQTHGIGSTLNQCIERCDIGNINIGGNGANCFYEGAIIRSGINGSITNVTTGNIITLTTNVITGTLSGVCGADGNWKDVVANCPNSTAVKSCSGGTETVKSLNNSQSCTFTWPSKTSGQSYSGGGSNGGIISGTCGSDGEWKNVVVNCPNSTAVKSCPGGTETVKSSNNSQSCTFTWPSMTSGQTYNAQTPNGGTLSGVCGADGNWKDVVVNCPNSTAVKSCSGGTETVKSLNNSQSCTFTWPSKTSGQSYSGGGSNGGIISGTCGSDGEWKNVVVNCPNSTAVKSCPGGTETVKSSNNSQSCTFTWPSMTSGQTYNAQTPNGGTLSGVCGADGNWKDVVVNCPNR